MKESVGEWSRRKRKILLRISCNYLILQLTEGHRAQTKSASDVTEHCWVGGSKADEEEVEVEEPLMPQQFPDKQSFFLPCSS